MHTQDQTLVGQSLTELESEALFALVEELEEKGWGYGFSCLFRCGVFTGPESEFDLCLASRLGERKLQWNLTSPSTVGRSEYEDELRGAPLSFMEHTLIWEYEPGKTDEETEQNFLRAARASIAEISALPRTGLSLWTDVQ